MRIQAGWNFRKGQGKVRFPKGAPFLPELERELLAFPNGPHDDQVNSISQALNHKLSGYTLDNL